MSRLKAWFGRVVRSMVGVPARWDGGLDDEIPQWVNSANDRIYGGKR